MRTSVAKDNSEDAEDLEDARERREEPAYSFDELIDQFTAEGLL